MHPGTFFQYFAYALHMHDGKKAKVLIVVQKEWIKRHTRPCTNFISSHIKPRPFRKATQQASPISIDPRVSCAGLTLHHIHIQTQAQIAMTTSSPPTSPPHKRQERGWWADAALRNLHKKR